MAVKAIDLSGSYFKFKTSLKKLGFKGDSLNIGVRVSNDVLGNYATLQTKNFKQAENKVERWEKKLKKLLSDPNKYAGGRRHASRKYPTMVSGELKKSVKVNLVRTVSEKRWVYEFTASATGKDNQAKATNEGWNSKRDVAWKNWFDETMNQGHSSSLVGARILMSNIFKGRM